jgi:hypothetical protein
MFDSLADRIIYLITAYQNKTGEMPKGIYLGSNSRRLVIGHPSYVLETNPNGEKDKLFNIDVFLVANDDDHVNIG